MKKIIQKLQITRRQIVLSLISLSTFSLLLLLSTALIRQTQTCPPPLPAAAHPRFSSDDNPDTFTVLVYNLKLRPRLLFIEGQAERVQRMVPLLVGYDAVIFAEGFDDHVAQQLITALKQHYLYVSETIGSNRGLDQDTGIIIASREPVIGEPQKILFQGDCRGFSCFNNRGIFHITIDQGGRLYHLITAQLQSGRAPQDQAIRTKQIQQIQQVIASDSIKPTDRVIFGGSLPIDQRTQTTELNRLRQTLALSAPQLTSGAEAWTVNPQKNPLAPPGKPQIRDYLFYSQAHAQPTQTQTRVRPLRAQPTQAWRPAQWFYWACPQQDLSDHYAIEGRFEYGTQ